VVEPPAFYNASVVRELVADNALEVVERRPWCHWSTGKRAPGRPAACAPSWSRTTAAASRRTQLTAGAAAPCHQQDREPADLDRVATMGFRGEALAAIASVAELSLTSRTAGAATGHRLDARSGELQPAARAVGTTVEVRELFFSDTRRGASSSRPTPPSWRTAWRPCAAMRWRDPTWASRSGTMGRLAAQWRAGLSPAAHRHDVLGAEFLAAQPRVTAACRQGLGDACARPRRPPDAARSRAPTMQYAYVNGRFVRDRWRRPRGAMPPTRTCCTARANPPTCCSSSIDPARVDVNVHPTKIEVRLSRRARVHQAVQRRRRGRAAPIAARARCAARRPMRHLPTTMGRSAHGDRPATPPARFLCDRGTPGPGARPCAGAAGAIAACIPAAGAAPRRGASRLPAAVQASGRLAAGPGAGADGRRLRAGRECARGW
jgi:DNA mismatch repair protein MutL